jgi:hypothetical protein
MKGSDHIMLFSREPSITAAHESGSDVQDAKTFDKICVRAIWQRFVQDTEKTKFVYACALPLSPAEKIS